MSLGRYSNKLGKIKIGTALVAHVKDITFNRPTQDVVLADELDQDDAEVLDLQQRGVYSLDVTVNLDPSDTTGQVVMEAAYASRTQITPDVVYAPIGFVTGNPTHTGKCMVTQVPNKGGQGRGTASGTYRLVFVGKPTDGVMA